MTPTEVTIFFKKLKTKKLFNWGHERRTTKYRQTIVSVIVYLTYGGVATVIVGDAMAVLLATVIQIIATKYHHDKYSQNLQQTSLCSGIDDNKEKKSNNISDGRKEQACVVFDNNLVVDFSKIQEDDELLILCKQILKLNGTLMTKDEIQNAIDNDFQSTSWAKLIFSKNIIEDECNLPNIDQSLLINEVLKAEVKKHTSELGCCDTYEIMNEIIRNSLYLNCEFDTEHFSQILFANSYPKTRSSKILGFNSKNSLPNNLHETLSSVEYTTPIKIGMDEDIAYIEPSIIQQQQLPLENAVAKKINTCEKLYYLNKDYLNYPLKPYNFREQDQNTLVYEVRNMINNPSSISFLHDYETYIKKEACDKSEELIMKRSEKNILMLSPDKFQLIGLLRSTTFEGTISGIMSSLFVLIVVSIYVDGLSIYKVLAYLFLSVVGCFFEEAICPCDNLVIPFVFCILIFCFLTYTPFR